MAVTALVLADTHLRTGSPRWLPESVLSHLRRADVVLHAGDVLDAGILRRLSEEGGAERAGGQGPAAGPVGGHAAQAHAVQVHAVQGNNDITLTGVLPHTKIVELAGVRIGMIHDSGRAQGRDVRLHRRFPDCKVVVFGHSHEPMAETGVDGQLLLNPGSPTQRRRQPFATFGLLRVDRGEVVSQQIVRV